jgi:uncharacterized protein (DUF488 family)
MTLGTIGFTRTSAQDFFGRFQRAGVRTVVDVRLHNASQLDDLRFFLHVLPGIGYEYRPELAPTPAILHDYRKHDGAGPGATRRSSTRDGDGASGPLDERG